MYGMNTISSPYGLEVLLFKEKARVCSDPRLLLLLLLLLSAAVFQVVVLYSAGPSFRF